MNNNIIVLALVLGAAYFILNKRGGANYTPTIDKRQALINEYPELVEVYRMTSYEINDVYDFMFNYIKRGTRPQQGSRLYNSITAIGIKYNIFT